MPGPTSILDQDARLGGHALTRSVEDGASTRVIAAELAELYGIHVSHMTVSRWLNRHKGKRRTVRVSRSPKADEVAEAAVPLPVDPVAFAELCRWRHMERRHEFVDGLGPIARDFMANRSSFRLDDDGQPIPGSDLVAKPRKVYMTTSVACALITWALLRFEAWRALTTLQASKRNIINPLLRDIADMIRELPTAWTGGYDVAGGVRRIGTELHFDKTGSVWSFDTAGASAVQADKQVRVGLLNILHGTEVSFWQHPSEFFSAAEDSMPVGGWVLFESTLPDAASQWFAQNWLLCDEGRGRFLRHHFWPWYAHPDKRYQSDDPRYVEVMTEAFAATMLPEDLGAENLFDLDDGQRAFRRWKRCRGGPGDRRRAVRENPETVHEVFAHPENLWFAASAVNAVLAASKASTPLEVDHPVSAGLAVGIYEMPAADQPVIVGVDPAEFGPDATAIEVINGRTWDQLAEGYGNGLDSEVADTVVWILHRLGVVEAERTEGRWVVRGNRSRYVVIVERQKGVKILGELRNRGVRLWRSADTKKPGYSTSSRYARSVIYDAVAEVVEGPTHGASGMPREKRPECRLHSKYFANEIAHCVNVDGQPDHASWVDELTGKTVRGSTDRIIAYGLAVIASGTIRTTGGSPWRPGGGSTTRKAAVLPA